MGSSQGPWRYSLVGTSLLLERKEDVDLKNKECHHENKVRSHHNTFNRESHLQDDWRMYTSWNKQRYIAEVLCTLAKPVCNLGPPMPEKKIGKMPRPLDLLLSPKKYLLGEVRWLGVQARSRISGRHFGQGAETPVPPSNVEVFCSFRLGGDRIRIFCLSMRFCKWNHISIHLIYQISTPAVRPVLP